MRLALWAAAFAQAATQPVPGGAPVPDDGGAQLMRETENYAWRTEVVAHEAAVAQAVPAVQAQAAKAADTAAKAEDTVAAATVDVKPLLVLAQDAATKAQAALDKVKELADKAEADSASVAKAAAEAAVESMWKEADAYYASKEAHLASLATIKVNPKAAAAQKSALPYMKAALDTQGMVFQYNERAKGLVAGAFAKVQLAKKTATQANQEQAVGDVIMANRHMIQAHGLMVTAQLDEDQAKSIYALAREFNQVIPMYQGAANQAAVFALSLPQMDHKGKGVKSSEKDKSSLKDTQVTPDILRLDSAVAEVKIELAKLGQTATPGSEAPSADSNVPRLRGR